MNLFAICISGILLAPAAEAVEWSDVAPDAAVVCTGSSDPRLFSFDRLFSEFVREQSVPGLAVAVTDQGRLVYARGFGYADREARQPVQPTSQFRIASLSKPITAAAVLRLVDQGRLSLDDRVWDLLRADAHPVNGAGPDARLREITVRQVLQHRGGWDRDVSFDPMFRSVDFARRLGVQPPAGPSHIIQVMFEESLDFAPGARYAYSNFGYCLLGRVIEAVSGCGYEQFVQRQVLAPLGVRGMRLGRTRPEYGPASREVHYYDRGQGPCVFPDALGASVPQPYGAWYLEAMDAHGGWLASVVDLARFAAAFDRPERCQILRPETIETMFARPPGAAGYAEDGSPKDVYYSLGWMNRCLPGGRGQNQWHTGSLPGTTAILIRRYDGRNFVALLNSREGPDGKRFTRIVDRLLHQAANAVTAWPEKDQFSAFDRDDSCGSGAVCFSALPEIECQ